MNTHLTPNQIDGYLAGLSDPETARHAGECAACRAQLAQLSETMVAFRASVRETAELAQPHWNPVTTTHRAASPRRLAWAALAACLLAGLTLPRHWNRETQPPPVTASAISDAELLVQVDRELGEAIPPSFEPVALRSATLNNAKEERK